MVRGNEKKRKGGGRDTRQRVDLGPGVGGSRVEERSSGWR